MPSLGRYRFSFDTWKVLELEEGYLEESGDIGDPEVELSDWEPLEGVPADGVDVVFVDGIRRTENLIYVEDEEGNFSEGAFVSLGAGALYMRYGRTNLAQESFQDFLVRRYLFIGEGIDIEERSVRIVIGESSLEFFVEKAKKELSPYVNEVMAKLEWSVAERVFRSKKPKLMITDGTVHYSAKVKALPFVGYVKKHKKRYVPSDRTWIFRELKVGQRTPIVLVHSQPTFEGEGAKSFDKFTWYIRISEEEGISGLARLEVPAGIGLERAREIANLTAWLIPRFASTEFSDRRAPQNLLPIKHLEDALRRRLGSQTLIRRTLLSELR